MRLWRCVRHLPGETLQPAGTHNTQNSEQVYRKTTDKDHNDSRVLCGHLRVVVLFKWRNASGCVSSDTWELQSSLSHEHLLVIVRRDSEDSVSVQ